MFICDGYVHGACLTISCLRLTNLELKRPSFSSCSAFGGHFAAVNILQVFTATAGLRFAQPITMLTLKECNLGTGASWACCLAAWLGLIQEGGCIL